MKTKVSVFDQLGETTVMRYTLINTQQTRVSVLSHGGILQEFVVREHGVERSLIWSLPSIADYRRIGLSLCQSIGRVAGRIGGAGFTIDGRHHQIDMNEQHHSLHGGYHGFNTLDFSGEVVNHGDQASVILKHHILATDDHYPGNLDLQIKFTLDEDNRLTVSYTGATDAPTLFNPTCHVYWNVTDDRTSLKQQWLQINGERRLQVDQEKVPTGEKVAVDQTAYDFRHPQCVQTALDNLANTTGGVEFDDAYEVTAAADQPVAIVGDTSGQRQVKIYSKRNSMVIYTADPFNAENEAAHRYNALATEAQTLPDAIHHPGFGKIVLWPDAPVTHTISYQYEALK